MTLHSYLAHFERFPVAIAISTTSVRKAKRIARTIVAPEYGIERTIRDPAISKTPRRYLRGNDLEGVEE